MVIRTARVRGAVPLVCIFALFVVGSRLDGTNHDENETDVRPSDLPSAVVAAVTSYSPGATIVSAEREEEDGEVEFEVQFKKANGEFSELEVDMSPDGLTVEDYDTEDSD